MEPKSRPALPAYLIPLAMLSAGLLEALETMPDGEEGLTEPLPVTVASYLGSVDPNDDGVWTLDAGDALRWKTSPDGRRIIFESGNYPEDDDYVRCLDLRRRSVRDRVALFMVRRLGGEYAVAERAWIELDRASAVWGDTNDANPILGVKLCAHRAGARPIVARKWEARQEGAHDRLRLSIATGLTTVESCVIEGALHEHAEAVTLGALLRSCDRKGLVYKGPPVAKDGIELT